MKVEILKTLKAGKKIWLAGEILTSPLPSEIHHEVRINRGAVRVIDENELPEVKRPVVSEPEFQDAIGNEPVQTAATIEIEKPKSKLVKRS